MFSRFFIDRPIFASVLSLVILLAGLVAIPTLPVAQYPQITPPSIIVSCTYPGASARVVAESVAAPVEQQVNGVEGMMYMSSQCGNDGSYSLTVTFRPGIDLNFAQVLVQNRVSLAEPLLPDVVKQTGVTTRKRNPDILMIVNIYSPNRRHDQLFLSNFATLRVRDELLRVDGVGDVFNFGQQDYSMRIWVDPDRLASLGLTAGDVTRAIREQNRQFAAGQVGQPPARAGQPFTVPITVEGRLSDPEEFEQIVLRTGPDGRKVLVKDVGRVELGARSMDVSSKIDGSPCTSLAVFQLPYANAIAVADRVRAKMEELSRDFPEDLAYKVGYDTSPFIRESVYRVFTTLIEAIVLVAVVVLVFLQNWRSTLIPLAAVPVAIVGTFAAMAAFGFSINNLTLFGLVLAIGIVVDDAIVVVEAIEHHIEQGLKPRAAAYKAMEQVSAPVVAVALVLSAVFVPCAFISGITGQFFRQFALTIAVSTIISAFNSLTLSPALAALFLKPRRAGHFEPLPWLAFAALGAFLGYKFGPHLPEYFARWGGPLEGRLPEHVVANLRTEPPLWLALTAGSLLGLLLMPLANRLLALFFRAFEWAFRVTLGGYTRIVGLALRASIFVLVVYGGLVLLTGYAFRRLPTGYIPTQDMCRLTAAIQLPDAASLERTQEVVDRISEKVRNTPGVLHTIAVAGQSFTLGANGPNFGNMFITLTPFVDRPGPDMASDAIARRLQKQLDDEVPDAIVKVLGPPPVSGLGNSGGFKFIVQDRSGDNDLNKLEREVQALIDRGNDQPRYAITPETLAALKAARGLPPALLDTLADPKLREFNPDQLPGLLAPDVVTGADEHYDPEQARRLVLAATRATDPRFRLTDAARKSLQAAPPVPAPVLDALAGAGLFTATDAAAAVALHVPDRKQQPLVVARILKAAAREPDRPWFRVTPASLAALRAARDLPETLFRDLERAGEDGSAGPGPRQLAALVRKNGVAPADAKPVADLVANLAIPNRAVIASLFTVFRVNAPQMFVDINREQCQALGVNPWEVFQTLQVYLGSLYVNDFNKFGRTWQVVLHTEGSFRNEPGRVRELRVRNARGEMVPLGAVLTVQEIGGPLILTRYNMYPSAAILGNTALGFSSGQGIQAMERMADNVLSQSMGYEWTEINYIQVDADKNIWNRLIFPLAVVFVFLVLAAQYESWALPLAVILVVPMCILGSLTGVFVTGKDINIFTQIGLVVLVGLASKNAILIVEFAKRRHEDGRPRREATLEACRLRLRPILMTSFAFILGVVPLMTANGAGAEMRRSLGIAVFSGMLGVTLFGIFLTPVFFFVIEWLVESPLFSSARLGRVSRILRWALRVATLGVFWLPRLLGRAWRRSDLAAQRREHALPQASERGAPAGSAAVSPRTEPVGVVAADPHENGDSPAPDDHGNGQGNGQGNGHGDGHGDGSPATHETPTLHTRGG